jgi:methyl-accepting chemotaxis protein
MNELCENVATTMEDLAQMFGALAEGDFSRRITADHQGIFGVLKNDANSMADRIASTISEIKSVGREVSNAAVEISTSTTDLSQRTEEQAASLEQTSASMEEMSATVKKNAENALQANQLTSGSRAVADRGGKVVAKAVDAMARIEDSARKISDIIGVIDEIARQTNLLALNAAVEAARAGDAGRGFAVVASEVRSLAQRSSQAAKDIKVLITNSSSQVQEGVGLVNQAGTSLTEILASIKQVADIVAEIASASHEQSTGIDQINKALTQMDEVTQQNSALVEENAASAKTLERQSETMNAKVAYFKLDHGAAPQAAKTPAPASVARLSAALAKPSAKVKATAAAVNGRRGGPVGRMQAAVAAAVAEDKDWQEF